MKWQRVNSACIRCGSYTVSRYTLSGEHLYIVWRGDDRIGDAPDGNKARRIAERHKQGAL